MHLVSWKFTNIMDALISTFNIDWKLLIAQLVNFGIVFFVVYKFALKPVMKLMDKRSREIAKSLDDAKAIEENLAKSQKDKDAVILSAKKEATAIVEESRKQGQKQAQEIVEGAKAEVQFIIKEAKEQIVQEKDKMLVEVKTEVADLVVEASKKVLADLADEKLDGKISAKSLSQLK